MSNSNSSQILWSQFTNAIAAKMGAGASAADIQILPSAQLLAGKTKKDINGAINKFVEVIPQWGAIYNPSDSTVIDAYQVVLTQAKETATNGTSIATKYATENTTLKTMMGKSSAFKVKQIQAYTKASAIYTKAGLTAPNFTDWFKNNGQQEYKALLDNQIHQTTVVKTLLSAQGIASPLVEALAALNAEMSKNVDYLSVPVTANPDGELLSGWKTTKTNPGSLTFDNASQTYDYSKSIWHSQTGTKLFGFISIDHRDETHRQENILSTASTYDLTMKFDAQASINITQGDWFNGAILKEYNAGPWVKGSQFELKNAHPYGDKDAIFPLLITRLYVVMNPSITIEMDQKDFSSVYDALNGNFSDGVNLGPFAFGGSNSSSSSIHLNTKTTDTKQSVTLTDKSNIPQIIAVVNELMP